MEWKTIAIIFIIFSIILSLITLNNISKANSWESNYNGLSKSLKDNYDYKCPTGLTNKCIQNGNEFIQYNPLTQAPPYQICRIGEYSSGCFDPKFQTSVICSKLDGLVASCNRI